MSEKATLALLSFRYRHAHNLVDKFDVEKSDHDTAIMTPVQKKDKCYYRCCKICEKNHTFSSSPLQQ